MSSLKTRWVVPYFASSSKALWFAKSSNCKVHAEITQKPWKKTHKDWYFYQDVNQGCNFNMKTDLYKHFFSIVLLDSSHELVQKISIFLDIMSTLSRFLPQIRIGISKVAIKRYLRNLSSGSPLSKANVELILQQILIVSSHINCYRQALQEERFAKLEC